MAQANWASELDDLLGQLESGGGQRATVLVDTTPNEQHNKRPTSEVDDLLDELESFRETRPPKQQTQTQPAPPPHVSRPTPAPAPAPTPAPAPAPTAAAPSGGINRNVNVVVHCAGDKG